MALLNPSKSLSLYIIIQSFGGVWSDLLTASLERRKGEFVPVRAINACRGSRGIAQLVLNLGPGWILVVTITSWPLYLLEKTPASMKQDAVWAAEPVWTF